LVLDADGVDQEIALGEVDLEQLGEQRLLWIDVDLSNDDAQVGELLEKLGVSQKTLRYVLEPLGRPRLDEYGELMHIEVSGLRANDSETDELVVLNCVVGSNWLLTAHTGPV